MTWQVIGGMVFGFCVGVFVTYLATRYTVGQAMMLERLWKTRSEEDRTKYERLLEKLTKEACCGLDR